MTTTEDLLRQSLRARADRTEYQPTSPLDVARRARELRRKRSMTTVLAAAATVAAVAVPAAVVLGTGEDPGRSPAPAGPAGGATVTVGSLSELPTGAPPAVDYLLDRTYVFGAGGRTELDVEPGAVRDAAPYPGGVLVTTLTPSPDPAGIADLLWFSRDGKLEYPGCGGEELALSDDGKLFAHVFLDGGDCGRWVGPVLRWGPTAGPEGKYVDIVTTNGTRVEPVGVTPEETLYNTYDAQTGEPMMVTTTTELGPPLEVPGLATAAAWDPATGRVAGCTDAGGCVVVDEQDGSVLLTLDVGEEPLSFSPDGRYLATMTGQGERSTTVNVRDSRTGDAVVTLVGEDDAYHGDESSVAWEDDRHLLLARVDADGEALVRLGVDGSAELATPVAEPTIGGYLLPGA